MNMQNVVHDWIEKFVGCPKSAILVVGESVKQDASRSHGNKSEISAKKSRIAKARPLREP